MKIAISTDGNIVAAHFGRCPEYTIIDIEDDKLKSKKVIANPGHRTNFLPEFLHNLGVEYIISGGIGRRARGLFDEFGIKTIVGITGRVDDAVDEILKGTLKGGESLCKRGSGKGYGLEKEKEDNKFSHP